jgi:hypothetical protein
VPVPALTDQTRWRCALCGNLTRFDVIRSTRSREYLHVNLAGEPAVEEREVITDTVEHVTCRWCSAIDSVELIPRPDAAEPSVPDAPATGAGAAAEGTSADPAPR